MLRHASRLRSRALPLRGGITRNALPSLATADVTTAAATTTLYCNATMTTATPNSLLPSSFVTSAATKQRSFASSASDDLAQKLLDATSPEDFSEFTPLLETLPVEAVPEVARAAALARTSDKAFRDALVTAATRALASLGPAELSSLVTSLAELGTYSVTFKDAVAQQILKLLPEFSHDQLGAALRSFASSSYYDSELLEGVASHLSKAPAESLTPCTIADVAYAFDKAGWCHPDLITLVERSTSTLLEGNTDVDEGECIAHMLDAVARVGTCEPSDPEMVDSLVARASTLGSTLTAPALATVVTSAARLGCSDERLLCPLLDAMIVKMHELSPKNLVKTVKALSELGMHHKEFLDAVAEGQVPRRLNEFSPDGLSDLLDAFNKLNYYSAEFLKTVQGEETALNKS